MIGSGIDEMKLTAYALGELDEAARPEVEAMLRDSAFARGYVQSVLATAQQLTGELASEEVTGLTAIQQASLEQRIRQAAGREPAARRTQRRWNRMVLAGSIAASILIVGLSAALFLPPLYRQLDTQHDGSEAVGHLPYIISDGTAPTQTLPGEDNLPSSRPPGPKIDQADDAGNWPGNGSSPVVRAPGGTPDDYRFVDNPFRSASDQPLSAFAPAVGFASYANIRRSLAHGELPPVDAVRVEELLNYFAWHAPKPAEDQVMSGDIELSVCPWNVQHRLARIILQARDLAPQTRPAVNIANGSLIVTARDVRITVKMNPVAVGSYRLIGYESHLRSKPDADESVGEDVGAGHCITALYELAPARGADGSPLAVHLRFRRLGSEADESLDLAAPLRVTPLSEASDDFYFAAAVAEFAMLLRPSDYAGSTSFASAIDLAQRGRGADEDHSRAELIELMRQAQGIAGRAGG